MHNGALYLVLIFAYVAVCKQIGVITFIRPNRNTNLVGSKELLIDYRISTNIPNAKVHLSLHRQNWANKDMPVLDYGIFDPAIKQLRLKTPNLKSSYNYYVTGVIIYENGTAVSSTRTDSAFFTVFSLTDVRRSGYPARETGKFDLFDSGSPKSTCPMIAVLLTMTLAILFL